MRYLLSACAALTLSGCVGSFDIPADKLPTANLAQLCGAVMAGRQTANFPLVDRASAELERRNLFTQPELAGIVLATARPGMSEQAGLCAWGYYWRDVNSTTTAGGTNKQYVFGDGRFIETRYLYTRNGRVTATQP